MPVQNIFPPKCQFSMPQITKTRSLSSLAAVVLLAGVSYAVSKPVYNFVCRHEIIWLKTPFDRIASVRDAICSVFTTKAEGSHKVESLSIQDKYEGKLGLKGWLKLAQSLAKSHPEVARSIYKSSLTTEVNDLLNEIYLGPRVLDKVEGAALLLEAYKLGKSLGLDDLPDGIIEYVKDRLNLFEDIVFLVAVAEFIIDNPDSKEVFETTTSELIEEIVGHRRYPKIRDSIEDLNVKQFVPIFRLMTKAKKIDIAENLHTIFQTKSRGPGNIKSDENLELNTKKQKYKIQIDLILDYLAALDPLEERNQCIKEIVGQRSDFINVLKDIFQQPEFHNENGRVAIGEDVAMRIINQNIADKIDNPPFEGVFSDLTLIGPRGFDSERLSALEKVMCLVSYAGNYVPEEKIVEALERAKEICKTIKAPSEKVKPLSLLLEAQIKHSKRNANANAKDTLNAIEQILRGYDDIELDTEIWTRIALADSKLNYSVQTSSSAWWKFWA